MKTYLRLLAVVNQNTEYVLSIENKAGQVLPYLPVNISNHFLDMIEVALQFGFRSKDDHFVLYSKYLKMNPTDQWTFRTRIYNFMSRKKDTRICDNYDYTRFAEPIYK